MNYRHFPVTLGLAFAAAACGQNVISAKAGLVQHVEGRVLLEGQPVEIKYSQFPQVKNNQVLETDEGRAEVLLSHASFLRLGENSSFRMISDSLTDTRFEVLRGTALVEVAELPKESEIDATFAGRTFSFRKNGLYRFDSEPSSFRVYEGEAAVGDGSHTMTLKKGHMVELDSETMVAQKFDPKVGDELYRWAAQRDSFVSMASVASARTIRDSGMSYTSSGWYFNPWYGMFTYVPMNGAFYSPFGFGFWSPGQVMYAAYPVYPYSYGGSGGGGGGTSVARQSSSGAALYTGGKHYDSGRGYNVGPRGSSPAPSMGSASGGSRSSSSGGGFSSHGTSMGGGGGLVGGARGGGSGVSSSSSSRGGR
jgi:hypothetical protein